MKTNLPPLNEDLLKKIFDGVYAIAGQSPEYERTPDERIQALLDTLYAMQRFNYRFRPDDTRLLFDLFDAHFNFERNSEGTTMWLALILAIQELYGFTDGKLVEVIRQVTARK